MKDEERRRKVAARQKAMMRDLSHIKFKGPTKYDLRMIRDFLDHFTWELRIMHHEHSRPEAELNVELSENLARYQRKYNTYGLFPHTVLLEEAATPEETAVATAALHRARAKVVEETLRALEELRPWLDMALKLAKARSPMMNPLRVKDILEGETDEAEDEPKSGEHEE